ncbi:transposase [Acetobacter cerevisiae DSM 14362]|nr:transposase [Acetobacter cerevisiae DSM 14362]
MSPDGGTILLKQADDSLGLSSRFSAFFRDGRHPAFVEYQVEGSKNPLVLGLSV